MQMPGGVPAATVAIGGHKMGLGLLAVQILALTMKSFRRAHIYAMRKGAHMRSPAKRIMVSRLILQPLR